MDGLRHLTQIKDVTLGLVPRVQGEGAQLCRD
jgi:hypothetical protein